MSEHLLRLVAKLLALLTLLVPGLVPDTGGPRPDRPDRVDLSDAAPAAFEAHGSVEQVWLTGAVPGEALRLVSAKGRVVAEGVADDQGSLILRGVRPRDGYRVAGGSGDALVASAPLEVTAPDDPPDDDFYESKEVGPGYQYLETRDGTLLSAMVRLPGPVEDGPYPTVVEYSGYSVSDPDAQQPSALITGVLGYATVSVNLRGSGCSGGAYDVFETLQGTDGYDVVETIAAQDWVEHGEVGMVGLSFSGITQLFVAQWQPPSLAAIAPLSVIADTARGTASPGGIKNSGFARSWAAERDRDAQPGGQAWSQRRIDAGDAVCAANQALRGQSVGTVERLETEQFWTDELALLAPELFVDRIEVPVFMAGAWQDEQTGGYFANMFDDFTGTDDAWFTAMNGGHTDPFGPATFGRWMEFLSLFVDREVPAVPPVAPLVLSGLAGEIFGVPITLPPDRFTGVDDHAAALAQFRQDPRVRILFDNGAGGEPGAPVPVFEVGSEGWPVDGTAATSWWLGEGGALAEEAPAEAFPDAYRYDPSRKDLTTFTGPTNTVWRALPDWRWTPPPAGTSLAYETAPLDEPLAMAGTGSVDLWLRSNAPDVDLQATISEVRPDGQERYIQSGWLRASHRALHPDATELRPLHLHTEEAVTPLPAGEWSEARIELFPFAHAFRAGSRIRIVVDAPGGSRPRWQFDALEPEGDPLVAVALGGAHASKVVLPVLPDVEVEGGPAPCPSLRFQPCRDTPELRGAK